VTTLYSCVHAPEQGGRYAGPRMVQQCRPYIETADSVFQRVKTYTDNVLWNAAATSDKTRFPQKLCYGVP
jgi:hypothetical protein